MRKRKLAAALLFSGLLFIMGCDGCYNEDLIDNKTQAPAFSLVRDTFYTVEMTSGTEGASIKYTVDGTDPKTSESAVTGNSASIDFFIEIKAYAFKDDMIASETASYRLPTFNRTINVKYQTNMNVEFYSYSELDGNEKKKIEVFFNGKGPDSIWFTEDDLISGYHLFIYDSTGLIREDVYNNAGADAVWFTADDALESYYSHEYDLAGLLLNKRLYNNLNELQSRWSYEYNPSSQISFVRKYDAADTLLEINEYFYTGENLTLINKNDPADTDPLDGTSLLGSIEYAYSGSVLDSISERDSLGTITAFSKCYYDNVKEYSVFEYDAGNSLIKETKYKGYGTDTEFSITEYSYTTGILTSKTEYADALKLNCVLYVEYFYNENNSLDREDHYTSPSREETLYSYQYTYNEAGLLIQKDKYNSDETAMSEYVSYEYDENNKKISETLNTLPDPNSFAMTLNLTVSAGYINGGYISSGGVNFNYEGVPAGTIIDAGSGQAEVIKNIITQIKNIYNNTEITGNGIIISGTESGKILITVRLIDNSTIIVNYDFQSFNNGDVTIDGEVTKTLEGTINLDGDLAGSLNGEITGSLAITDADPVWTNDAYLINKLTVFEYDSLTGLLANEKLFVDAGEDGAWETAADNNQQSLTEYYYDTNYVLTEIKFYKGTGPVTKCSTADEISDYRLVFTYSNGLKIRADKYCEYGTYIKSFSGAGDDTTWNTIDDIFNHSSLEFSEK